MGKIVSIYPVTQSDAYVKATSKYGTTYWPYFSTDPAKSLTGNWDNQQWLANAITNQRLHFDLGVLQIIRRIYYENSLWVNGLLTDSGVKNFTFWGSSDAASFAELTYATDTGWTQLSTSQSTFDQHTASDVADPKYIVVANNQAYRYYAFKFADNWGDVSWFGVRRIELQVNPSGLFTFNG
jgi:hypothetical protein